MTNKTIEKITRWLNEHCDRRAALCLDSRQVESGDIFVARAGQQTDGYRFIQDAVDNGAAAVIYDAVHAAPEINRPALAVTDLEQHIDRKSTRLNSSHVSISYAVF